jgi:Tesmin/TSO1-like CXC domain, cysteine-rich domain
MEQYLEKRPDAFTEKKPKQAGLGCACKNNRCVRKYCECYRTGLSCTAKCCCRKCENGKVRDRTNSNSILVPVRYDAPVLVLEEDDEENQQEKLAKNEIASV